MKVALLLVVLVSLTSLSQGPPEFTVTQAESMEYPLLARLARIQGKVILSVDIDSRGQIGTISVKEGHPILSKAAEESLRRWSFGEWRGGSLDFVFVFKLVDPQMDCPKSTTRFSFPNAVTVTSNFQAPMHGPEQYKKQ